jgi:hypothetical protein
MSDFELINTDTTTAERIPKSVTRFLDKNARKYKNLDPISESIITKMALLPEFKFTHRITILVKVFKPEVIIPVIEFYGVSPESIRVESHINGHLITIDLRHLRPEEAELIVSELNHLESTDWARVEHRILCGGVS